MCFAPIRWTQNEKVCKPRAGSPIAVNRKGDPGALQSPPETDLEKGEQNWQGIGVLGEDRVREPGVAALAEHTTQHH